MGTETQKQKRTKRIVQVLVTTAIQGGVMFASAGRLDWGWAWGFLGMYLFGILINSLVLMRINPGVIAERADSEGMKGWDKLVGGVFALAYFLGVPLVSGLDVRFGWTAGLPVWEHVTGAVVFAGGMAFFVWAMAANARFSTVVRVGDEGTHRVAMSGPYRIVRHPGYLGAVLQCLGLPLILGSWWGMAAGGAAVVALFVRTALEDRTLQAELPGYLQLVQQTPYRLLPGIW